MNRLDKIQNFRDGAEIMKNMQEMQSAYGNFDKSLEKSQPDNIPDQQLFQHLKA